MKPQETNMTKENTIAFGVLKKAIMGHEHTMLDIFEFLGVFMEKDPPVGRVFLLHMRDIIHSDAMRLNGEDSMSFSALVAETYRRVFFDDYTSNMYGARDALRITPRNVAALMDNLLAMFKVNNVIEEALSSIKSNQGREL